MTDSLKAALALFSMAMLLFFLITPNFVEDPGLSGISPRYFPNIATLILGFFSAFLVVQEWRKGKIQQSVPMKTKAEKEGGRLSRKCLLPGIICALLLLYIMLFAHFGFLFATPLILVLLMVAFGQRRLFAILLSSVITTFLLYQLFQNILGLALD